jgi:hypothetical protein
MSESNKSLVYRTQVVLSGLGYQVKTTHIHEMFARVLGYPSVHAAAKKKINYVLPNGTLNVISPLDDSVVSTTTLEDAEAKLDFTAEEHGDLMVCAEFGLETTKNPRLSDSSWRHLLKLAKESLQKGLT